MPPRTQEQERMSSSLGGDRLSVGEKVGYGLGDAAANFIFQTMIMFQLAFYTDTFGITAAAAGTLFLVVRVFGRGLRSAHGRDRRPHEHAMGQVPPMGAVDRRPLRRHGLPHLHHARLQPVAAS